MLSQPMPFRYIKSIMNKVDKKIVVPKAARAFFAKCGAKGGSSTSKKKSEASRRNGCLPCKPGKFRGRPKSLIKVQSRPE